MKKYGNYFERCFICLSIILLLVAAAFKIIALFGNAKLLREEDSLFPFLTIKKLFIIAVVFEMSGIIVILALKRRTYRLLCLCWIGTVFSVYHIGLWCIHASNHCRCLGNLGEWLGISPESVTTLSQSLAFSMCIGSVILLITRHASVATVHHYLRAAGITRGQ